MLYLIVMVIWDRKPHIPFQKDRVDCSKSAEHDRDMPPVPPSLKDSWKLGDPDISDGAVCLALQAWESSSRDLEAAFGRNRGRGVV